MTASEFARRRARIERESHRKPQWKTRALAKLVQQARATPVSAGGRVVAWRMQDGATVCVKWRYADQAAADDQLAMIARTEGTHTKPQRSYLCPHCHGWHLSSSPTYF